MPKPLLETLAACPECRVGLDGFACPGCGRVFEHIGETVNLLPRGQEAGPPAHPQERYNPFITDNFLPDDPERIVLEIGAGDRRESRPNIVMMDVGPGRHVDALGDAHRLPFGDASFDFVFSLSVLEHLRNPFRAAEEMFRVLKPGGRVFCDTNFVFPYHSFPHHYFNFSIHGLMEVFSSFEKIDVGIPPYGTPGYAVVAVLERYLNLVTDDESRRGLRTTSFTGDADYKGWMLGALDDVLAVHGEDTVTTILVPMTSQLGIDAAAWADALEPDRPELSALIRNALASRPAPPLPPELLRDPRLTVNAMLHLPWKKWDELLDASDAHMISSSIYFHGRKPA